MHLFHQCMLCKLQIHTQAQAQASTSAAGAFYFPAQTRHSCLYACLYLALTVCVCVCVCVCGPGWLLFVSSATPHTSSQPHTITLHAYGTVFAAAACTCWMDTQVGTNTLACMCFKQSSELRVACIPCQSIVRRMMCVCVCACVYVCMCRSPQQCAL